MTKGLREWRRRRRRAVGKLSSSNGEHLQSVSENQADGADGVQCSALYLRGLSVRAGDTASVERNPSARKPPLRVVVRFPIRWDLLLQVHRRSQRQLVFQHHPPESSRRHSCRFFPFPSPSPSRSVPKGITFLGSWVVVPLCVPLFAHGGSGQFTRQKSGVQTIGTQIEARGKIEESNASKLGSTEIEGGGKNMLSNIRNIEVLELNQGVNMCNLILPKN